MTTGLGRRAIQRDRVEIVFLFLDCKLNFLEATLLCVTRPQCLAFPELYKACCHLFLEGGVTILVGFNLLEDGESMFYTS